MFVTRLTWLLVFGSLSWQASAQSGCGRERGARSLQTGELTEVSFKNDSSREIVVHWIDGDGRRSPFTQVDPNDLKGFPAYMNDYWMVTDTADRCLFLIRLGPRNRNVVIR